MNVWHEALRHLSADAPAHVRRALVQAATAASELLFERAGDRTFLVGDPAAPTLMVMRRATTTRAVYAAAHAPNVPQDVSHLVTNQDAPPEVRRERVRQRVERVLATFDHECRPMGLALRAALRLWVDPAGRVMLVYRGGRGPAMVKRGSNAGTLAERQPMPSNAALDNV